MKIRQPSYADLQKMDDLLLDIQRETFHLQICIRDNHKVEVKKPILFDILDKKDILIEQLQELVRDWSYVPLCAACYLKEIPITTHTFELNELEKMDDYITRIHYESHQLRRYKRNNKRDENTLHQIEDTVKTKRKIIVNLRDLTQAWDYVPMCAADLLEPLE